jgi:hypothetical protein
VNKGFPGFIAYVRRIAEDKRQSAGYNGEWSDGGAGELEKMASCFEAGLIGAVPACLKKYYDEFEIQWAKDNDPEYKKYLELKKKFDK